MTFWSWLAQFVSNITYIVVAKLFFGRDRFYQALFAILTISQGSNTTKHFFLLLTALL